MNDRYEHLLRKARDAKRGGHEAWTVQSTGETVAVALVLNRADWLPRSSTPSLKPSSGVAWSGLQSSRRSLASLRTRSDDHADDSIHRFYQASGIIAAILLALARWDSYRQTHACVDLPPVHRDDDKCNTYPRFPWTGWTRPARSACNSTQPQEAL